MRGIHGCQAPDRAARVERGEIERSGRPACVRLPQRHARGGGGRAGRGGERRLAGTDRGAEEQARASVVTERRVLREVMGVGERELLVPGAQRRRTASPELERGAVERKLRRKVPLRKVESGREPGAPAPPALRVAAQPEAAFAPGAGDGARPAAV